MEKQILEKKKPSFLFLSNGYPAALDYFTVEDGNYESQKLQLSQKFLDVPYLYTLNLRKLGYRAEAIISNHEALQKKWAEENGVSFSRFSPPHLARKYDFVRYLISKFPKFYYSFKNLVEKNTWNWQILLAQIKEFKPDILQIFDLHYFTPQFLKEARKYAKKIVGLITSPIMLPEEYFRNYDLLLSSLPHYVERFKNMGIPAFYLPYAFEPEILKKIDNQKRKYDCVYAGSLSKNVDKVLFLEELAKKVNIDFWGYGNPPPDKSSPIWQRYHGQAWGIDVHRIFAQSKIVVNRHTRKVGKNYTSKYADNVRLYEATGSGALLITDARENLGDLFEVGKEVVAYSDVNELVEKINYYLQHDKEREKIAQAGQERTLRDHTYETRAKKLLEIINYKP